MDRNVCNMAKLKYCRKSIFGFCNADEKELDICPYRIEILKSVNKEKENILLEDDLK